MSIWQGVDPRLRQVFEEVERRYPGMARVTEGMRGKERQRELVNQGFSKTMNSRHLRGGAVDVAPLVNGKATYDWQHYYPFAKKVKAVASELGVPIEWGGDWKSFKDGPHWQIAGDTINASQIQPGPAYQGQSIQPVSTQQQLQPQGAQPMPQGLLSQEDNSGGLGLFEPTLGQRMASNPLLQMGLGIMASGNIGSGAMAGLAQANQAQSAQQKFQLELARSAGGGQDLTALERQLAATGLQPGTPQYQQAMWKLLTTPKTNVETNVTTGKKERIPIPAGAPSGAIWKNPEKPGEGMLVPDPNSPTQMREVPHTVATASTAGEATKEAQIQSVGGMLSRYGQLLDADDTDQLSGMGGLWTKWRARPEWQSATADSVANFFGNEITPDAAEAIVLSSKIEKELIAAMRGAAVGPEEEKNFVPSLPVLGTPKMVQKINAKITEANIEYLNERAEYNRGRRNVMPTLPEYEQIRLEATQGSSPQSATPGAVNNSDAARRARVEAYLPGVFNNAP